MNFAEKLANITKKAQITYSEQAKQKDDVEYELFLQNPFKEHIINYIKNLAIQSAQRQSYNCLICLEDKDFENDIDQVFMYNICRYLKEEWGCSDISYNGVFKKDEWFIFEYCNLEFSWEPKKTFL